MAEDRKIPDTLTPSQTPQFAVHIRACVSCDTNQPKHAQIYLYSLVILISYARNLFVPNRSCQSCFASSSTIFFLTCLSNSLQNFVGLFIFFFLLSLMAWLLSFHILAQWNWPCVRLEFHFTTPQYFYGFQALGFYFPPFHPNRWHRQQQPQQLRRATMTATNKLLFLLAFNLSIHFRSVKMKCASQRIPQ